VALAKGDLSNSDYETAMKAEIKHAIDVQEELGIDVLVHGEAERTDMVEYFAGLLDGFWLSKTAFFLLRFAIMCVGVIKHHDFGFVIIDFGVTKSIRRRDEISVYPSQIMLISLESKMVSTLLFNPETKHV
jgi:methionine synthase II (cobalamin-independent)